MLSNLKIYVGRHKLLHELTLTGFGEKVPAGGYEVWLNGFMTNATPILDYPGLEKHFRIAVNEPTRYLIHGLFGFLHPEEQMEEFTKLREYLAAHPNINLSATVNSPYLVDLCEAAEVRVVSAAKGIRMLIHHPDYEFWKDTMRPGEFWLSVGEDW